MKTKHTFKVSIVQLFVIAFILILTTAQSQTNFNKYCFNANVTSIAKSPDGGVFLGGGFTDVAEYCGRAVKFNTSDTPEFNVNDAKIEGNVVRTIVPIPGGGWYLGGNFNTVSNTTRNSLVRINADGSLNDFNLALEFYDIRSMVMDNFGRLFVAGYLNNFGITIICINPDGTFTNFQSIFNNVINTLAMDANGNLYVGGAFTSPRNRLAKFTSDGTLTDFNPIFDTGSLSSIKFNSTGEFLVGGSFNTVNGNPRNRIAKFNVDTTLNSFNPVFNGEVLTIAVDASDNFYVGGTFTTINSIGRNYLAKFNANGDLNNFNPIMSSFISVLQLDNVGALYCGGAFTSIVGMGVRNRLAKFNPDGSLNSFNPSMNGNVLCIAINNAGSLYVGGSLTGVKVVTRHRLAKLNADGSLNAFNPIVNNTILALEVDDLGSLYIGGAFTTVGGSPRTSVAKFNPDLTLNGFNPSITPSGSPVYALATDSANNLYIGGSFAKVNTSDRAGFAKFNSNGVLSIFYPLTQAGYIQSIVIDNQDNVYVGGYITWAMGQSRKHFVKFNANETLASINPIFDSTVHSLALDDSGNIYAGGIFTTVNGQPRSNLAKINADGSLAPFNHMLNGNVRTILSGSAGSLFIGGDFTTVDAVQRNGFAKINSNGTINSFNPLYPAKDFILEDTTLHMAGSIQNYKVYNNVNNNCDLILSVPVPGSRCGTGAVNLSITPSSGTVNWYDAPQNGNLVGTGATFITPAISSTTTYYAEAVDGDCVSFLRIPVVATVVSACASVVNLKLFVQAYYLGGNSMTAVQFNQGVTTNSDDVETVTVELRHASTYALIDTVSAIVKTDGTAICTYPTSPTGSYYLVVKGLNFIETWSANPQTIGTAAPLNYDFTTSNNKAHGNNMIELEPGVFGFYSGDINQDGFIDSADYSLWETDNNNFEFGQFATDLNGDGVVDAGDFPVWETNNNNYIYSVTPQ